MFIIAFTRDRDMFYNKPNRIKFFKCETGNTVVTISLYYNVSISLSSLVTEAPHNKCRHFRLSVRYLFHKHLLAVWAIHWEGKTVRPSFCMEEAQEPT